MNRDLLTAQQAAQRLGISTASIYGWLAQSNAGTFRLRGQPVTIAHLQSGPRGRGHIKLESVEVDRLIELMKVHPRPSLPRSSPVRTPQFPGITVKLGRPS